MARIEARHQKSITSFSFISNKDEHLVTLLVTETRINKSGRQYTRRLTVTLTTDEFARFTGHTQTAIDALRKGEGPGETAHRE